MGLIKCPDCGNMVSERAAACPSCGCPADAFEIGSKPDHKADMASYIAYPMYKTCDRLDLMLANNVVLDYLKNNLSAGRPITFFSIENSDIAEKTARYDFTFPYVMVTSSFRFFLDYRKFTLTRADGRSYSRYYDEKTIPGEYAPRIEVISDNEVEAIEITEKIKELFKEPKTFSSPFLGGNEESLSFSCEIETILNERDIYDGSKTVFLHKTVVFKYSPWASYIDDAVNPTQNESMRFYRKLQYAQFCISYAEMKDECDSQLTLYEWLYLDVSKMRGAFGPSQTEEYKILKNRLQSGQPFDADLVDKAFPNISLLYHQLPNDISKRTPFDEIRKKVYGILDQYKTKWERTCAEINLPNDFVMYGKTLSVRDNDGLTYVLGALDGNMMRSFDDVFEEIKAKVTEMYLEEQREAQEGYYEPEPQSSQNHGGSSFLGGVIKTAAGVALGNKISQRGKQNYMGSPNCERAKTGRHTSCWGCGLGDYCTMHDKY